MNRTEMMAEDLRGRGPKVARRALSAGLVLDHFCCSRRAATRLSQTSARSTTTWCLQPTPSGASIRERTTRKRSVRASRPSAPSWTDFTPEDLRVSADVLDGVALTGTGPVSDRLWGRPSVNVIGLDMTDIATSSNVLIPAVRAKISMRIVPGSDPEKELDTLVDHLEAHTPWGAQVEVQRTKAAPRFLCETGGPGYAAAHWALEPFAQSLLLQRLADNDGGEAAS